MRIRWRREVQLAQRTAQLEREREENARRAVFNERVRIARELHDVVAHHVSVMGVQAGAARRVLATQPAKAAEALSAIESSSRQAVSEMQRLLGFLRQDRDVESLAPQPSMRQLASLIAQMRDSGLPVDLRIEGNSPALPPSVDLSAYRIVQEALTNTLKHAGAAKALVMVRYADDAGRIEVTDNGPGTETTDPERRGNGLIGMRERASLLGGWLQAEHHPGVGFSVRAYLPFNGQPS
jgi:signal transduction histidine kinase